MIPLQLLHFDVIIDSAEWEQGLWMDSPDVVTL